MTVIGQRIQSLDRGLQLLEYIAEQERPVRLTEMARLLEVEKSSAYRLVNTLATRGYVRQEPESSGYLLDERVFDLAGRLAGRRRLGDLARRHLVCLARETGETAHLGVLGDRAVVLVDHEFGSHAVGVTSRSGSSEPLYCTALGKALLAGMTEDELRTAVRSETLKRHTERTVTTYGQLAEETGSVMRTGLARDWEEYRAGVRCLASPVFDFRSRIIGAIGISGPKERIDEQAMTDHGERVRREALALSAELGFRLVPTTGDSNE
ncbi:MAG: IclR family transcriptional regulator [Phycisphaerae bacterium]|nr:IclR family transcriptional regulator [Phycisphaerae bacterium]